MPATVLASHTQPLTGHRLADRHFIGVAACRRWLPLNIANTLPLPVLATSPHRIGMASLFAIVARRRRRFTLAGHTSRNTGLPTQYAPP